MSLLTVTSKMGVSHKLTIQAANISKLVVISKWRPKPASRALCLTMLIIHCTASCFRRKTNSNVAAQAAAVSPVTSPVAKVTKNLAKVWPVYLHPQCRDGCHSSCMIKTLITRLMYSSHQKTACRLSMHAATCFVLSTVTSSIPVEPSTRLLSSGEVYFVVQRLVVERFSFSQWLALGPLPKEGQRQNFWTGCLLPVCLQQGL